MSESNIHRHLISKTAQSIQHRWPEARLTLDISQAPGDEVPFLINDHRPDIIGQHLDPALPFLIAEIKTSFDINKSHTCSQINAFLQYLNDRTISNGVFIFAVEGTVAPKAQHFLYWACHSSLAPHVEIMLFDGLDFWTLNYSGERTWRLC
ncbi:MAG: hypothetical protein OXF73_03790 [Gammaproteobacteria bacterium]|nr:hypothetical protein [Gammaproteobacteria bacterium]